MSTPHNSANNGEIAKLVLMPGDPLRAKMVAETFLEDVVQFNNVRGMNGYTGTYKGNRVSVMGSGMGCGSIGIYSYELYKFYGVEAIIRVGSTGAMVPSLNLFDVILVDSAYSESSYAVQQAGVTDKIMYPTEDLNALLESTAKDLGVNTVSGRIISSDVFYYEDSVLGDMMNRVVGEYNCVAAEMESFALFHNANILGKKAACLLTVSDSLVNHTETTAEERQNSFTQMMEIALGAAKNFQ